MGFIKGDTRSLDNGSYEDYKRTMGFLSRIAEENLEKLATR